MSIEVHDDEAAKQFYTTVDGHQAVIRYAKTGDVYDLEHTFVPEELRGHHLGQELVRGALDQIQRQGARFLPSCPFVQTFVKQHPEYQEGVGRLGE